jgi:plasmid stabilization system protein ParE
MSLRVVIEEPAATDIALYAEWIVAQGAPLNAARWVNGIELAIASLSMMPERCGVAPESAHFGEVIRQLLFKSHRILFVVDGKTVHVLHVRHGAMRTLGDDDPTELIE